MKGSDTYSALEEILKKPERCVLVRVLFFKNIYKIHLFRTVVISYIESKHLSSGQGRAWQLHSEHFGVGRMYYNDICLK